MLDKLKEFGKHSAIYGVGNALSAIGGFVLIPFYTHMLTTSEYGILELLNRSADVLILIIMLGIRQAFIRFYFDDDTDDWHQTVLGTTVVFLLASSAVVLLIFWPMKEWVAQVLFDDPIIGVFFTYIIVWIPLDLIVQTGLTHLQIQMKSLTYVIINFFKFVTFISSNIILLYYFDMGILGVLVTNIWISAIIGIGFLIKIYKWTHFKFSRSLLKSLILFGLPYLPTTFFGYIISNSDRYFLSIYSDLDAVGIYAVGFKIGFLGLALVMEPLGKIWTPFLFDNYDKPDGPKLISKVFTINVLVGFTIGLMVAIGGPLVIPWITEESFHSAYKVLPYVCLASVFWALASMADYGILIRKKTIYKPFIFCAASVVVVIADFILVPLYAGIGAAIGSAIGFFALLVINFSVSNNFYHVALEYKKILLISIGAAIVYSISVSILNIEPDNVYYQILSVLSFVLFPIILWAGGLLSIREKEMVLGMLGRNK